MNVHGNASIDDQSASVEIGEDHSDLREGVRRLCARFPGEYWRGVEAKAGYPSEFVTALTEAGYLAALIPEEFGGAGLSIRAAGVILEEINASGCTASQCHAQMYIMGTLLRHGSEEQKQRYLPRIASGELRLQAFGVTEPTTGSDTTKIKTRAVTSFMDRKSGPPAHSTAISCSCLCGRRRWIRLSKRPTGFRFFSST
jgi:acyl-CoA dehydrogenase